MRISSLFLGILFGTLLIKAEVASWFRIEQCIAWLDAEPARLQVDADKDAMLDRIIASYETAWGKLPVRKSSPWCSEAGIVGPALYQASRSA